MLTPREKDVLRLLMQAKTNGEIARELGVNEQTVKNHISTLLGKFQVRNRLELALTAMRTRGTV